MRARTTRPSEYLDRSTTPWSLFLAGALLFPAFLFQQDLGIRLLQLALFFLLNALRGRRVRVLPHLVVGLGIVIFNLIIPTGRVIIAVAGFPVTSGALRGGVAKATTVIGMIALSQFAISTGLNLPGRLGGLVGRSLYYFERIMAKRKSVDRKKLIESVDSLLLDLQGEADQDPGDEPLARISIAGFLFLSLLVTANWAALICSLLKPGLHWGR
jgi:hypothetical protein